MVVNILVRDSYHTERIAETLQGYFGDKVVCYKGHLPPNVKADLFVLSGRDVLCGGPDFVSELKEGFGSQKAKVMAVSTMDSFLREIDEDKSLGVDFTFPKGKLVEELILADKGRVTSADVLLKSILEAVS